LNAELKYVEHQDQADKFEETPPAHCMPALVAEILLLSADS